MGPKSERTKFSTPPRWPVRSIEFARLQPITTQEIALKLNPQRMKSPAHDLRGNLIDSTSYLVMFSPLTDEMIPKITLRSILRRLNTVIYIYMRSTFPPSFSSHERLTFETWEENERMPKSQHTSRPPAIQGHLAMMHSSRKSCKSTTSRAIQ